MIYKDIFGMSIKVLYDFVKRMKKKNISKFI